MKPLFIILLSLFVFPLTGQIKYWHEIPAEEVPGYIKAEFATFFDTASYYKTSYCIWSHFNGRFAVNAYNGMNEIAIAFDSLLMAKIDSTKIPLKVRQQTLHSENRQRILWLFYPSKPGYFVANTYRSNSPIQICYDSLGNVKYYMVLMLRNSPAPLTVSIPAFIVNEFETLSPTAIEESWTKGGIYRISYKEDTTVGHYCVHFKKTEDTLGDTGWTKEFDSLGNICQTRVTLFGEYNNNFPGKLNNYLARCNRKGHRKRYFSIFEEYLDATNSVQSYTLHVITGRIFHPQKNYILTFNKTGKLIRRDCKKFVRNFI